MGAGCTSRITATAASVKSAQYDAATVGRDGRVMLEFLIGYTTGQHAAGRAASLARSAAVADGTLHSNRIEDLNERIDAMAMILRAMWALLEEQGLTADQLVAKVRELDLGDGVHDGQARKRPVACAQCGSMVAPGLTRCQYCGTDLPLDASGPFDRV